MDKDCAVLHCMRCGSTGVDVYSAVGGMAEIRCSNCGQIGQAAGFSLGRVPLSPKQRRTAFEDVALPVAIRGLKKRWRCR